MNNPDRRSKLLDSYENAAVVLSGLQAEDLGRPTPCRNYDVGRLVDHIVEAGRRAAALGRGQAPPAGDDSPHVEVSFASVQLRNSCQDAAQAWQDESTLSLKISMPWGEELTGTTLVDMYLVELATHSWDLAYATDQIDKLDRSVAAAALEGARAVIKPQYRDVVEPGSPFGLEVAPPPDADDWERLGAFMGRDPRAPLGQQ